MQNEKSVVLEFNKKLNFSKLEYDFFLENAGFTKEEIDVFELRQLGYNNLKIQLMLNISSSTVDRTVKKIKKKIIKVISQNDGIMTVFR